AGLSSSRHHSRPSSWLVRNHSEYTNMVQRFAGENLDDDHTGKFSKMDLENQISEDKSSNGISCSIGDSLEKERNSSPHASASAGRAMFLMLKAFVGTGVLFLPRAFANGGLLFSSILLALVAAICWFSFILLVKTYLQIPKSFGD